MARRLPRGAEDSNPLRWARRGEPRDVGGPSAGGGRTRSGAGSPSRHPHTGRQQRLSRVPTPLWVALILGGCIAVAVQLTLAGTHVRAHALLVAALATVMTARL